MADDIPLAQVAASLLYEVTAVLNDLNNGSTWISVPELAAMAERCATTAKRLTMETP